MRIAFIAALLALGCGRKSSEQPADPPPPVPAVATASDAAERAAAVENLRKLGEALAGARDVHGYYPFGSVTKQDRTPCLSWRVSILPYIGEGKLHSQFKFEEPWDSEHNKKFIGQMPAVFASPGKAAPAGETYLRTTIGPFGIIPEPQPKSPPGSNTVGPGAPKYYGVRGLSLAEIRDGTSNTLLVAEAAESVVWTKPDELGVGREAGAKPDTFALPKFGGPFAGGFHALMCDGTVHFFQTGVSDRFLRGVITPSGGENLQDEWDKILYPNGKPPEPPSAVPESFPDAAARRKAVEHLQAVARGVREDEKQRGLPAGFRPHRGVGLSWRVQFLPRIGESALFNQFKFNEPWDSEHNKTLLDKMPAVFAPAGKPAPAGHTHLRMTQGPQGVIPSRPGVPVLPGHPLPGRNGSDVFGRFLVVEAADAVPWTKADELEYDDQKPVPKLGGLFAGGFHAATLDGSVWFIKENCPADEIRGMVSLTGRQTLLRVPNRVYVAYRVPAQPGK